MQWRVRELKQCEEQMDFHMKAFAVSSFHGETSCLLIITACTSGRSVARKNSTLLCQPVACVNVRARGN
jgi:hypothetical protein